MAAPIQTLLLSTLYPSSVRPGHGIFVETRLRELLKDGQVATKVIAPVPWFPSANPRFGDYATLARTPAREQHNGIDVLHPRFLVAPKVGMNLAPFALAATALRSAKKLLAEGFDFDLIDAHYFYPDGVAAAIVARALGKPLFITARGSDVNLIAQHAWPRRMMLWAARQATGCIGVSQALVNAMHQLGMPADRLHMLRNGVDLDRFQAMDRAHARARIGHEGQPLLLSVGNLIALKGHDLCIDALALLLPQHPGARLLVVGVGPDSDKLTRYATDQGVADRVHLVGAVPNAELPHWYSAADCLLLASSREGWPNVLLEAMACGTPVVASNVGGIPEIVSSPRLGRLLPQRDAKTLAASIHEVLLAALDRSAVRAYAQSFGWQETSQRQHNLFAHTAQSAG